MEVTLEFSSGFGEPLHAWFISKCGNKTFNVILSLVFIYYYYFLSLLSLSIISNSSVVVIAMRYKDYIYIHIIKQAQCIFEHPMYLLIVFS